MPRGKPTCSADHLSLPSCKRDTELLPELGVQSRGTYRINPSFLKTECQFQVCDPSFAYSQIHSVLISFFLECPGSCRYYTVHTESSVTADVALVILAETPTQLLPVCDKWTSFRRGWG